MATYSELRIRFERAGSEEGAYVVHAAGPAGETEGRFSLPLSKLELENLALRLTRGRAAVRRVDSPELELVRRFGGDLFNALFSGGVRDLYRDSLSVARGDGNGLRLSLALARTPELMNVPWEFLYDEPRFLSHSTLTPVVRYLDLPRSRRPLAITPPLRILGMVSSPADVLTLDVAQERRKLEQALEEAVWRGAVEIRWLEQATLPALQRELRRGDCHVFHYIGHGGYDSTLEDGVLLLEDEVGRSRRVSGAQLGTMLADETSLRLAVLNACEGARTSSEDPFGGVAASLVEHEVPAVVAMQFEITDRAAIIFAAEFYSALADGYPADSALAEARKAMFADQNDVEWGTPVLFMRVPDGRIFDVAAPAEPRPPREKPEDAPPPVVDSPPPGPPAEERRPAEGSPVETRPPPPPVPPPVEQEAPRVPVAFTALALAGAALLLAGIFAKWDQTGRQWIHITGPAAPRHTGILTALPAFALVAGAVWAVALALRPRTRAVAAGLLIGVGVGGAVKYLGVLGLAIRDPRGPSVAVFTAVVAGACMLVVAGALLASRIGAPFLARLGRPAVLPSLLLLGATTLIAIGVTVRFNGGAPDGQFARTIVPDEGWLALDPVAGAVAALALALVCLRGRSGLLAGLLIALALESSTLWLRYLGVPFVIRYLGDEVGGQTVASVGAGAVAGFLGSALVVAAAWLVWRDERSKAGVTTRP